MHHHLITRAIALLFGCAIAAGCGGGASTTLIPATDGPQNLRLTFASFTASAQTVAVYGSNATLSSGSCATVTQIDSNDFSVAPTGAAGVNACYLWSSWTESSGGLSAKNTQEVHVGIQMSVLPGKTVQFVADEAPNNYTASAQSYSTSILTVANNGNGTASNKQFTFSLTGVAPGTASLGIYCNGCSGGTADDWDVPITVIGATPTPAATATPTATPTPAPTPTASANSFTLANASSQTFTLSGSTVGAKVSFFGSVTISGASSESVSYSESTSLPSNGCSVTGTTVDAITLTFPTAFSFAPNGSGGPTTGLLDTTLTPPSPSGTYYGAIYQAGSCVSAFSPASAVFAGAPYEYLGGGNTSVPAGTYILELWH